MRKCFRESILYAKKCFVSVTEVWKSHYTTFVYDSCIEILSIRTLSHLEVVSFLRNDLNHFLWHTEISVFFINRFRKFIIYIAIPMYTAIPVYVCKKIEHTLRNSRAHNFSI